MYLVDHLHKIEKAIQKACERSGRNRKDVLLLAVSKTQTVERIQTALNSGLDVFGENYVQELQEKILDPRLALAQWDFIGRLQRNKVKSLIGQVRMIHSIDNWDCLAEVEKKCRALDVRQNVLLQINSGEEASKGGFSKAAILKLPEMISRLNHTNICGLMCLPPFSENPEASRPYFQDLARQIKSLKLQLPPSYQSSFVELSMGTSHDFEVAIEEGATIIRVGTSLFGPRAP